MRRVPAAAAAAVLVMATPTAAAPTQDPDDGLSVETAWTYQVEPAAGAIRVTVEVTLGNHIPNQVSGGVIRQTYFPEFGLPVLTEATELNAVGEDGNGLPVRKEATESPYVIGAVVDLRPNLFYGDTQRFSLSYTLPGLPPRSAGTTRANPAFASFIALVYGDPGVTSVEVHLPSGFQLDLAGSDLLRSEENGEVVLRAQAIDDPASWYAGISLSNQDLLEVRPVEAGEHTVSVESWPGDTEWADFVGSKAAAGLPVLEADVGLPVRDGDGLRIIETVAPYLYGYSGWYDDQTRSIEVGDELDALVVLHELCHLWFNDDLFTDRWILEGLAETYAVRALREMGESPAAPVAVDPAAPGALALSTWSDPYLLDETSEETEAFGYGAAWAVVDALIEEIGTEGMRAVIAAADADLVAYRGDPEPEVAQGAPDWRRFLDLLERVGGSTNAEGLFRQYVLTPEEATELDVRRQAIAELDALTAAGDGWTAPLIVRQAIGRWDFAGLGERITQAEAVLHQREELEEVTDELGVEVPVGLESAYESAMNLRPVGEAADEHLLSAAALREADGAIDDADGLLAAIGMFGSGADDQLHDGLEAFAASDLATAHEHAERARSLAEDAEVRGLQRAGGAAAVAVVGSVGWRWRRRRTKPPAPEPPLEQDWGPTDEGDRDG